MDILFPGQADFAFSVMVKPIGPVCNLNCTYCYYLEKKKLYPGVNDFKITDEVLEIFIKQYIEVNQVPVVSFVWQGGEPCLMGLDFFKKVIKIQEKYSYGKRIENSFQTNGTLISEDFCRFFRDNNFLVGISIDGPEHIHDRYRLTNSGNGSFKRVMEGIDMLHKHKVDFNTLSVVNNYNSLYPLEVYNFLKNTGSGFIQFIPVVERASLVNDEKSLNLVEPGFDNNAEVTEWSVDPIKFGKFLCAIFDEWVRKDVGKYFVQIFDATLANWAGEKPGLCVFSERCGDAAVMEHNGDIYVCDHFVYNNHKLGNISEVPLGIMIKSDIQKQFGKDKRDNLPRYCFKCEYRFACNGECPKHRFMKTPDGQEGLNYLCSSYKMFFSHVHPYMQFMSDELKAKRAPANVMNWIRRVDKQKSELSEKTIINRNDPCPCGSGKKYKNCHINKPGIF